MINEMLSEVLACSSYNGSFRHPKHCDGIFVSGKQYFWIEESDYNELKQKEISVVVGYDQCGNDVNIKLQIEKIDNQKVIEAVLELGPDIFSTYKSYIGEDQDMTKKGCFLVLFEKEITYRSYPKWYSDIVAKI